MKVTLLSGCLHSVLHAEGRAELPLPVQPHKEPTMRHPKLIIAGIGLAAVAGHNAAAATVRTAPATVAGKTETILVTSGGLPLYFYRPDTAATSLVTGGVAALWPALTS